MAIQESDFHSLLLPGPCSQTGTLFLMIHAPIVVREHTDRKENIWALNIHRPRTHRSCPSSRASNEDGLTDHDHIVSASLPNPPQTWRLTQLEGHEHKSDQVHWAGRVGLLHRWRLVVRLQRPRVAQKAPCHFCHPGRGHTQGRNQASAVAGGSAPGCRPPPWSLKAHESELTSLAKAAVILLGAVPALHLEAVVLEL